MLWGADTDRLYLVYMAQVMGNENREEEYAREQQSKTNCHQRPSHHTGELRPSIGGSAPVADAPRDGLLGNRGIPLRLFNEVALLHTRHQRVDPNWRSLSCRI